MDELNLTYNAMKMELTIYPIDSSRMRNIEEVVRCKDCKWVEKGKDYEAYCNHWKSGLYANVKDDDFCSYGERKDNERKADGTG